MPTDRVLIEIITAANLAGVEAAQASFLKLNIATAALAVGLAVVIKVGKDALDNYKSQTDAMLLLKQAVEANHRVLAGYKTAVEQFITTNAAYINDQYDVIAAFAALVRAGNAGTTSIRLLNIALDMSAVKHNAVSADALTLEKVLKGNSKALREVGISTAQYTAIQHKHESQAKKDAEIMTILEGKYKNARKAIDDTEQSHNKLTIAWQNFTTKLGPAIAVVLTAITDNLLTLVNALSTVYDLLAKMGGPNMAGAHPPLPHNPPPGGYAGNAPVSGAGGIITNRGAHAPVVINIHGGVFADHGPTMDKLANALAQRLRMVNGI